MIITNKKKLPQSMVDAMKYYQGRYEESKGKSDITVTQLIKTPYMVQLEKQFEDKIVRDVSDSLWIILGQAVHMMLEKTLVNGIAESRHFCVIDGWAVSGQADYIDGDLLADYKVTSVWKKKFSPDGVIEWEQQLNLLRFLYMESTGNVINRLEVHPIYRDWQESQYKKADWNYPDDPQEIFPIDVWDYDAARSFLKARVELHKQADNLPIEQIKVCNDEDRWSDPVTFAVMKEGRKTALRVLPSEEDAEKYIMNMGEDKNANKLYIEERTGNIDKRCRKYCDVCIFCPYFQKEHPEEYKMKLDEYRESLKFKV